MDYEFLPGDEQKVHTVSAYTCHSPLIMLCLHQVCLWQLATVVLACHYLSVCTCRTQCYEVTTMTSRKFFFLAEDIA